MSVEQQSRSRQPRGVPVGGQFAAEARDESDLALMDPPAQAEDQEYQDEQDEQAASRPLYSFPSWKLAKAEHEIEKANRRAERAGIAERITYTVETYEQSTYDQDTGLTSVEERCRLELNRPTIEHDGWRFVATCSWDEEAGMISRSAGDAQLTERPTERLCDVCGQKRDRKDTYVVQRTADDGSVEQLQVGSDCLQQFTGIKPAGLWMLDYDLDEESLNEVDDGEQRTSRESQRFESEAMVGIALAVVASKGWVSRSVAMSTGQLATADRVLDVLYPPSRETSEEKAERQGWSAGVDHWRSEAAEVLEYARSIEGTSDYCQNLRQAAAPDSVSVRNLPLLLSSIASSRRAKEQAAERAARAREREDAAKTSQWVGKEKDKVADVEVTVTGSHVTWNNFNGNERATTILSMRDTDGNSWKWFATGNREDEFPVGAVRTMKGTIKGHDEWQGVKETVVTRAKLEEPATAPAS